MSVPIQPVTTSEDVEQYEEKIIKIGDVRLAAYLMKRVHPDQLDPTKIVTKLDLWFPCWNKCGECQTFFT